MNERLTNYQLAFNHPATLWLVGGVAAALAIAYTVIFLLSVSGKVQNTLRAELWKRTNSWAVILPLVIVPILAGALWFNLLILVLSLWSYAEFARATGLFRERLCSFLIILGIVALEIAVIDHWYAFFVALSPLIVSLIAALSIIPDRPKGYIQRVALAVLAFMLFGTGLAHLSYIGNDLNYRPMVLLFILSTQLNDIFAFVVGKTLGHKKLAPNTSPNKTIAGSLGAIVLTTLAFTLLGRTVFANTAMDSTPLLCLLGALVSISGQCGDLMLSSIKRDLGIKDMAATIPGHGGVIDRVNSLLLSSPTFFHFVGYVIGFGLDQPTRILSGS